LLGKYENFPRNIHGIALIEYGESIKNIEEAIFFTFFKINQESYNFSDVASYLEHNCIVLLELGVADGFNFNFLDNDELERCVQILSGKDMNPLDFFVITRYYKIEKNKKRVPLKFDFQIIRFNFQSNLLELQIHNEKGPQRIPIDDLTDFMAKKINSELSQRKLSLLKIKDFLRVGLK
jgi:hypothetical protein